MAGEGRRRFIGQVLFGAPVRMVQSLTWYGRRRLDDTLEVTDEAINGMRPKGRLSRHHVDGYYRDGGVDRFQQLAYQLSEDEILLALHAWRRERLFYLIAALAGLLAIPVLVVLYGNVPISIFGLCIFAILMLALSTRADFRAWQIVQRRVGSLRSYFNGDMPPHMHLIERHDD